MLLWFVEITDVLSGINPAAGRHVAAGFVRLDNDVISPVGPHPSTPWSVGLQTDESSAGMCHFCFQELLKVTSGSEWRRSLISLRVRAENEAAVVNGPFYSGSCVVEVVWLIFIPVVVLGFTTRHVSSLEDYYRL